jgi:hypothetical protein
MEKIEDNTADTIASNRLGANYFKKVNNNPERLLSP